MGTRINQGDPGMGAAPKPRWLSGRERWLIVGVSSLALLVWLLWQPIQQQVLTWLLLRSPAPSPEVLAEVTGEARDPANTLDRLWRTRKIPHRRFVLDYLTTLPTVGPELRRSLRSLIIDAATDPDFESREKALDLLAAAGPSAVRPLALGQLKDADPAVRALGLSHLRSLANSNDVATVMPFLRDPDPRVVVSAASVLRHATGQDFGLRLTQAMPRFTFIESEPPPQPEANAIAEGVQRWLGWWSLHQTEFPLPTHVGQRAVRGPSLLPPDCLLEDLRGKKSRLFDYLDHPLLLAFWDSSAAGLSDLSILKALQARNAKRLRIIAISLHTSALERDHEHQHAHAHGHEHCESPEPTLDLSSLRAQVGRIMGQEQLGCTVLIDPAGAAARGFDVRELPAYVLVDRRGQIQRSFVGGRAVPAFEAMVDELVRQERYP